MVNGAKDERRPDFRRCLRLLLDRRRAELRRHPPPSVLIDYHRRMLSRSDADRLREHLALCRSCTDRVLALSASGPRRAE